MVNVTVRFFGPLKDIAQTDVLPLALPQASNGEAAFESLAGRLPRLRDWRPSLRLAVNLEYAPFDSELHDGDEVSFIPPVSGG